MVRTHTTTHSTTHYKTQSPHTATAACPHHFFSLIASNSCCTCTHKDRPIDSRQNGTSFQSRKRHTQTAACAGHSMPHQQEGKQVTFFACSMQHLLTCCPALMGGYCSAAAAASCGSLLNGSSGCSVTSEAMCENSVDDTRQQLRPAAAAAATAAWVASVTTTCNSSHQVQVSACHKDAAVAAAAASDARVLHPCSAVQLPDLST